MGLAGLLIVNVEGLSNFTDASDINKRITNQILNKLFQFITLFPCSPTEYLKRKVYEFLNELGNNTIPTVFRMFKKPHLEAI